MNKGLFITFEGGEGSGKTSLIKKLEEILISEGYDVLVTREPGGIDIAEKIRTILLDVDNSEIDNMTETLLFAASRRQHLVERIIPAIKNKKIILCDRFVDSSLAYQAIAREVGYDLVYDINKIVIGEYMPDLTVFVDCKPTIGLNRINENKREEFNRLDKEKIEFHNKVYNAYLEIIEKESPRIKKVNGENCLEDVYNDTLVLIREKINEINNN